MKKMTVISMVFLAVVFLAGCPVDSTVDGCVRRVIRAIGYRSRRPDRPRRAAS